MKFLNKIKNLFGRCKHELKFLQIEMNESKYKPEIHLTVKELYQCIKCGEKKVVYRYEKI